MAKVSFMRKQAPTFSVPNLADVSPEYVALTQKRDKLAQQHAKLEIERSTLMEEISREMISQARRERDQRVAALLDDESPVAVSRPHVRLSEIGQEISDIKAAISILEGQISQARNKASAKIREDVRPEYAKRVEACCNALLILRDASADYLSLTDELHKGDVDWLPLNPMPVGFCGNPHERYSKTAIYLREAAKSGYFDYAKIPTELR